MSIGPGSRVGPYEVTVLIGEGGMGKVWRARHTALKRDDALKVLPDAFADHPDRLARFQREAEVLASLNHPNIAAIYGLEESSSGGSDPPIRALVMELVEGLTLNERVALGALPIEESLSIATQITDALEAAHEKGIVHRDLKPANVKVRADGTVKVLDFGLAKALTSESAPGVPSDVSHLPTIASPATSGVGVVLGTAAYMSPEQARGKPVDKRSDIWAFGCVLYEMLTAHAAFSGDTLSDTIAAVLGREPDWDRLPEKTPPIVRRLLSRCLEKDPKRRLRDIGDARFEIEEARSGSPTPALVAPRAAQRLRLAWTIVAALVTMTAAAALWRTFRSETLVAELRVELTTPPTTDPTSLAIAPDGRTVAFVGTSGGRTQLWVRALDSGRAQPWVGTDAARSPFWSPDSRSVGFFADGKLRRIDIDGGGTAMVLADAPLGQGGAWHTDGTILFAPSPAAPLVAIRATGGQPVAVTAVEGPQQVGHSYPQFLPDGRHFLFFVEGVTDVRGIHVGELNGKTTKRLLDADAAGVFRPSGHVIFVRQGTLYAQRFDPTALTVTGNPSRIGEQVAVQRPAAALSASRDGTIVYRTGSVEGAREYVWYDQTGKEVGKLGSPPGAVRSAPSFARDGRTVALHSVSGNADIWLLELGRGTFKRFTSHPADEIFPVWSPDGARIAFSSTRGSSLDLYVKSATGTGPEDLLLTTPQTKALSDWSPDGRFLLYSSADPKTGFDIWILPMIGERTPVPLVQTAFNERLAQFSPDGHWIAYESNESGRYEIYLQKLDERGAKSGGPVTVSTGGGAQVRWRPDGKALFYLSLDDRLMTVPITSASKRSLELGTAVAIFATRVAGGAQQAFPQFQYSLSPDGERFLVNSVTDSASAPLTLLLNWAPTP